MKCNEFGKDDMVCVRIKGCPWMIAHEDVVDFFKDFQCIDKSALLGKNADGRNNGYAAMLFETPEEAERAKENMEGKYFGSRYVNLYCISYLEYTRFNSSGTH